MVVPLATVASFTVWSAGCATATVSVTCALLTRVMPICRPSLSGASNGAVTMSWAPTATPAAVSRSPTVAAALTMGVAGPVPSVSVTVGRVMMVSWVSPVIMVSAAGETRSLGPSVMCCAARKSLTVMATDASDRRVPRSSTVMV